MTAAAEEPGASAETRRRGPRGPYAAGREAQRSIVDAARAVFAERGFRAGSLRDVGERAGVSAANVLPPLRLEGGSARRRPRGTGGEHRAGTAGALRQGRGRRRPCGNWSGPTPSIATCCGCTRSSAPRRPTPYHPAHDHFRTRYSDIRAYLAPAIERARQVGALPPGPDAELVAAGLVAVMDGLQTQWLLDETFDMVAAFDAHLLSIGAGRGLTARERRPCRSMAQVCDAEHRTASLAGAPVAGAGSCPATGRLTLSPAEERTCPIHPSQSSKFHLLEGIESFEAGLADPTTRARLDEFMSITDAPAPPAVDVRDDSAPGPHGPVPVRIYTPTGGGSDLPCFVWLHGGAFRMGDLDMPEADWTARQICDRAGAVVVSVDYRLCVGGVTYPVPHDDVVAAVRWVRDDAAALGVDAARISLGGASAGGNLATGAALQAARRGRLGARSAAARLHDVPRRRPAARRRRWRRSWTRSPGCSGSCPRSAAASPRTTSAAPPAGPTATRCRATPSSRACARSC